MKTYLQKHNKIKYSDNWATPKEIYNYYMDRGYHDPCKLYSDDTDLSILVNKTLYINPPYSNISNWVDWAISCYIRFNQPITLLIPSRTDTRYFHKLLELGVDLEFIKGRLKFGDYKGSAPFPSVLVHIGGVNNGL